MISAELSQQILTAQRARLPLDAALDELTRAHVLGNVARVGNACEDAISHLQSLLLELKDVRRQCDASVDKEMRKVARSINRSAQDRYSPSAPYAVAVANPTSPQNLQSSPYSQGA